MLLLFYEKVYGVEFTEKLGALTGKVVNQLDQLSILLEEHERYYREIKD